MEEDEGEDRVTPMEAGPKIPLKTSFKATNSGSNSKVDQLNR